MGRLWSGAHVENMGCKELFRAFQVHPGGREMAYTWMPGRWLNGPADESRQPSQLLR
jgi:hypothetical protein